MYDFVEPAAVCTYSLFYYNRQVVEVAYVCKSKVEPSSICMSMLAPKDNQDWCVPPANFASNPVTNEFKPNVFHSPFTRLFWGITEYAALHKPRLRNADRSIFRWGLQLIDKWLYPLFSLTEYKCWMLKSNWVELYKNVEEQEGFFLQRYISQHLHALNWTRTNPK